MSQQLPIAAIILCGGESRRMGRAKALLPWQGVTLLEHVVAMLAPVAAPIVVVAAPEQELPALPSDVVVVRDTITGEGPLRGLEAGLSALVEFPREDRADLAFVCGCDMPWISPKLITQLSAKLGQHAALVIDDAGQWQPLHALYRVDLLDSLRTVLAAGERSPQRWLRTLDPLVVPAEELRADDPTLRSWRGVNTPEEYEANEIYLRDRE